MNMDSIGNAMLMLHDELKNDKPSKSLIKKMDEAGDDNTIKDCFRKGVARLRELGKNAIADDLQSKTKGFAF